MAFIISYWTSNFGTINSVKVSFENKNDALIFGCNLIINKINQIYNNHNDSDSELSHAVYLFNLINANKLEEAIMNCNMRMFKIGLYENALLEFDKNFIKFANIENKKEIFK